MFLKCKTEVIKHRRDTVNSCLVPYTKTGYAYVLATTITAVIQWDDCTELRLAGGDGVTITARAEVILAILKWFNDLSPETDQMPHKMAYVDVAEKESQFSNTSLQEVVLSLKIP